MGLLLIFNIRRNSLWFRPEELRGLPWLVVQQFGVLSVKQRAKL